MEKCKGRKCTSSEKYETIKMGKILRGKERMSCNRDRMRVSDMGDYEREAEETEDRGG